MKKQQSKIFSNVGGVHPGRSAFDLSYEKLITCDMGELIPVMCDEVIPGDIFEIGNQALIRFQPLVAPIMHEVNVFVHYFFCPYRKLFDDWEDFITGGPDGTDTTTLPTFDPDIGAKNAKGSLWDYFGFPTSVRPTDAYPLDFPRRAYHDIYNNYYRDENLITEIDITDQSNYSVLKRSWEKDYFTAALPWQQRGTAPAFPIVGTSSAEWPAASSSNIFTMSGDSVANAPYSTTTKDLLENNTIDLSTATPLDIADMRLGFQVQKWMERNARAGARYVEFLQSHFGVSPKDERLQRPEYIGGSKSPVIISEVLQTSETSATAQGTMTGKGVAISTEYCAKYRVPEFGLIMGIMSVMPKSTYQQGINRQWLRETRYDFYFPEFANLSEQAIINAEIYCTTTGSENTTVFGYQGQYDEMRVKNNIITGDFRDTYDYWHLSRQFAGPTAPLLNQSFIECDPRKDCFAAPSEPGLLVQFGNLIKAIRPMPYIAEPGLIDH